VFFSFSGSKLPGYILPAFPAAAVLIGRDLERPRGWAAWGAGALLAGMGLAGLFLGRPELGMRGAEAMNFAAFSVLIALIYVGILFLRDARAAGRALPFCFAAMIFLMTYLLFPALANRESIRPLALQASAKALPGERLIFFVNYDHGINFYATGLPLRDTKSELVTLFSSDEISLLASASPSRSLLVLSHKRWMNDLTSAPKLRTEVLGEQALHVRCSPDCDWVLLRAYPK
jgi:4-amino-4-deoxy-L-arabinose transferase-like glycosyltransferase